ncbi:hypothetical protein GCM10010145_26820 [Streptomyces ruber]|uniref:Uncharacterized protein n=2 Tax=Streptomyces TaxID=1883 RepID=A0A918BDE9_9ACTN|nr:hypothetical protein [Streptomyces ruber]GGQ55599.1 hypothetical protein GCM10010145_26820 [Streptomyces ruber]
MPILPCHTCDSREPHRELTRDEKEWLKDRLVKRNVDDYRMCEAPGCRHVRTGLRQCAGYGDRHIRIPEPD